MPAVGGKHRHRQMLRAARTAGAIVDLAGRGLCGGDQVGRGLVAGLVASDQSPLHGGHQRYRLEILQDVPGHVRMQVGHHGHDAVVEAADRVAVRRGSRDLLGADQPGCARLVDDDDLLAHVLGHLLRHDPRGDVDGARRRQRHDHLDRPVGIDRLRERAGTDKQRQRRNQRMKQTHGEFPSLLNWTAFFRIPAAILRGNDCPPARGLAMCAAKKSITGWQSTGPEGTPVQPVDRF